MIPQLLGPDGQPVSSQSFKLDSGKKKKPPKTGPAFGDWTGRDEKFSPLTSSALTFDVSQLTLADFRAMKTHPQVNASLSLLMFMLHQIDFDVKVEGPKEQQDFYNENLRNIWTRLCRAMSQAFTFGFSPCVLEYENTSYDGKDRTVITKVKDLYPEECRPHYKRVDGWAPPNHIKPKRKIFDGIKQWGTPWPIPVENSFWYPFRMTNGSYYGTRLLESAFQPWYFSLLTHLYANRYYERFGEPVPVGRAPMNDEIDMGGNVYMTGRQAMEEIVGAIRSRSAVVLPSDRDPATKEFDYMLEYLEADMKGNDFEGYLTRLDEEISLAIFTPILMFKSGDKGSNNLGVQHAQTFLWMLNSILGDWQEYIEFYFLNRLRDYNFPGGKDPKFHWKELGKENVETTRAIISALIGNGSATVDLLELGQYLGMTVEKVEQLTEPVDDAGNVIPKKKKDDREVRDKPKPGRKGVGEPRATGRSISNRIRAQVEKAWDHGLKDFTPDYGHERRMTVSFGLALGEDNGQTATDTLYEYMDVVTQNLIDMTFAGPADFMAMWERLLDAKIDTLCDGD